MDIFGGGKYDETLNLEYVSQVYPDYCAPACVAMWSKYDSIGGNNYSTRDQIANWFKLPGNGGLPACGLKVSEAVEIFTDSNANYITCNLSDRDSILGSVIESFNKRNRPSIFAINTGTHAIILNRIVGDNPINLVSMTSMGFKDPEKTEKDVDYSKNELYDVWNDSISAKCNRYVPLVEVILGVKKKTDTSYSANDFNPVKALRAFYKVNGTYYGGPESFTPQRVTKIVRVKYPLGTDELHLEDIEHIKWESNGLSGNIKLELLKGDAYWGTIATNLPIQQGDYRWKVGLCQNEWATMGDNYKIKITMMDGSDYDTSNVDFSIIEPLITHTITASAGPGGTINPSGSVTVVHGADKTFNITADSCYIIQNVMADGFSMGAISSYKFDNVEANHSITATFAPAATYTITATTGSGGTITPIGNVIVCQGENKTFQMVPNSGYGVQSVTVDGANQGMRTSYTFSDVKANHTIAVTFALISVNIITPNGGENWEFNTYQNITWNAPGITGNIQLSLYRNGKAIGWIANCPAAPGTYSWKVGTNAENTPIPVPAGNGYSVSIKSMDGAYVDTSNAPFNITRSSGSLTLTAPNGGENWQYNTFQNITWSAPGVTGNVQIILYRYGAAVGWIANRPASQGTYSWKVGTYEDTQTPVPIGGGYAIEIKSIDGNFIDESDATFNIVNPSVYITLTNPKGDESWHFNTYQNITWNYQGISGNVQIYLYRNGAKVAWLANWATYKKTFDWKVGYDDENLDLDLPAGGGYSILIKSGNGVYTDMSDGTFTVY